MSEWRDIATAPKDGRAILACWRQDYLINPHIEAVYYDGAGWSFTYDGDSPRDPPSHWMPLPEPPK